MGFNAANREIYLIGMVPAYSLVNLKGNKSGRLVVRNFFKMFLSDRSSLQNLALAHGGARFSMLVARLSLAAAAIAAMLLIAPQANAGIIKVQQEKSCNVDGLDAPDSVTGGVHCDQGNPFSLTDLLNGDIGLWVGDSQTPSWNIVNDTGVLVESLTLYFSGTLASNANVDMQISGDTFRSCTATTRDNVVTTDGKCGSKDKTANDPALALMMEWSGGAGLELNQVFNLGTASFSHSGDDGGCFSGTADCQPGMPVPEPGTLALLGLGLAGMGFTRRRRKAAQE